MYFICRKSNIFWNHTWLEIINKISWKLKKFEMNFLPFKPNFFLNNLFAMNMLTSGGNLKTASPFKRKRVFLCCHKLKFLVYFEKLRNIIKETEKLICWKFKYKRNFYFHTEIIERKYWKLLILIRLQKLSVFEKRYIHY